MRIAAPNRFRSPCQHFSAALHRSAKPEPPDSPWRGMLSGNYDAFDRAGEKTAMAKLIYFAGLGSVFHPQRREVQAFVHHGLDVFGQRTAKIKSEERKVRRAISEMKHCRELIPDRVRFLNAVLSKLQFQATGQHPTYRLTLAPTSFAIWYALHLAVQKPEILSSMNATVMIAPFFQARKRLALKLFHHFADLRNLLEENRKGFSAFVQVARETRMELGLVVPLNDTTARVAATQAMYEQIDPRLNHSALIVPQAEHFPFTDRTPEPERHIIYRYIEMIAKGEDVSKLEIDASLKKRGIRLLLGRAPWPTY